MKRLIPTISLVALVLLSVGGSLFATGVNDARAQYYIKTITVGNVVVRFSQDSFRGGTEADVNRVYDDFVAALNGSDLMIGRVVTAGVGNPTIYVRVSRDNPTVLLGRANDGGNMIWIDVGDTDAMLPHLEDFEGSNASTIANSAITWVLAHEIVHLLGVLDPQTDENPVILPLKGFERLSYWGYCKIDGTEHIPFKVGSDEGSLNNTSFQLARGEAGGLLPSLGSVCGSDGSAGPAGGIAELPNVAQSPDSSTGNYAIAGVLALVAVVAFAAGGWYARRRWLS